jgi:hypothetical protein
MLIESARPRARSKEKQMLGEIRPFVAKSVALVAVVIGLGVGGYGVASAAGGYNTSKPAAVAAPAAPPAATAQTR